MTYPLPKDLLLRHPTAHDHSRVLAVLDHWWAGSGSTTASLERTLLLPRLFVQHFTDTSFLLERDDGSVAAFLVGFLSQSQPDIGYIHFVGVAAAHRRSGVATALYHRFFSEVARRGATTVNGITSPGNTTSIVFHRRLGFEIQSSDVTVDGVPVQRDYDGPGLHRVAFTRPLTDIASGTS